MSAGKTYTLDLVSEDFNAYLRIEHDDKGKLAEDDDGAGFLNSRIVFTPDADGTYRLVVTTCDGGQAVEAAIGQSHGIAVDEAGNTRADAAGGDRRGPDCVPG